jgi:hypothetical protein
MRQKAIWGIITATASGLALASLAASPALASPATGAGLAVPPALTAPAQPALSFPPNIHVCTVGGTAPCDATTQHTPVFFYPHDGSARKNIGIVTVLITCHYTGTPVVNGDNVEDHVTQIIRSDGTAINVNGHVPDYNINLNGHNPGDDGIPAC